MISQLAPYSPAEERLIAECTSPSRISVGDGELPHEATPETSIRAEILRALLLDEDHALRLHNKGLRLRGAWIVGTLDLQGTDSDDDISLTQCVLDSELNVINARLRGLYLTGCKTSELHADNATFSGSFYIRGATTVEGEISLAGARIGGDLQICDAVLNSKSQDALFAPSLRVDGSVFLGNYPYSDGVSTLKCSGGVFLSSARIGHDFFVTNTAIHLPQDLLGSPVFGATEEHGHDIALSLARAHVGGLLYFQDNQIAGVVNLAGAVVVRLKDEPEGPGAMYPVRLDGFRYEDFSRHSDVSLKARLAWLARTPADLPFSAQPYEHLANVLQNLGHRNDARTVLMRKERLLRAENRALLAAQGGRGLRWGASWLIDHAMRVMVGYGYRSGRAFVLALVLIFALGVFFQKTWDAGDMTPNAAPILVSKDWVAATLSHPENPAAQWASIGQAGQDFETFNAFAYAADLVIPLIVLGQESAWAPSTSRSEWGRMGWWLRWLAKGIGWVVTALAAAALTGIIRQD